MKTRKHIGKNNRGFSMLRSGKLIFLLGIALMLSIGSFAQDVPLDNATPDATGGDPDAPFDGGVSLLVAAGVAYGAKQWKESRKSKKNGESNLELEK